MHLIDVVLFAHVTIAIVAFSVAGILHVAQFVMRGATSTTTVKAWDPIAHRLEPLFPVLALVLFGLGAWLVGISDGEFGWSDGWVITAAVGLGVMEAAGGAVLAPHGKRQHAAIVAAPDGPVGADLRAHLTAPLPWAVAFLNTATAIGILFLMATKPNGVASAIIVVACGLAGAALGVAGARGGRHATEYRAFAATEVSAASAGVGDGK
jgi:hypothetical protein